MAQFVTDSQQMETAARRVEDVDAQVAALLSSLRAEVGTAPAHFKGSAAATFGTLMARYDADAARLSQALRGIAEQIAASGRDYAAQDTARSDALRSSGSGLNMS